MYMFLARSSVSSVHWVAFFGIVLFTRLELCTNLAFPSFLFAVRTGHTHVGMLSLLRSTGLIAPCCMSLSIASHARFLSSFSDGGLRLLKNLDGGDSNGIRCPYSMLLMISCRSGALSFFKNASLFLHLWLLARRLAGRLDGSNRK